VRLAHVVPIIVFLGVAVALGVGLTLEPRVIPSALIDKPVPEFELPPVAGREKGLAARDLRTGTVSIVNVFASWCGPCRIEHPLWMDLATTGRVALHGLNYKDAPENASAWLDRYGDPYARTGADRDGRVGIDWGVYGVPETFVIDRNGRIVFKHVGVMTRDVLDTRILPLIDDLEHR
jgi:cytochrome c biogenesis protein CcmG/thiol:disulfide interchange protein DsbE